MPHKVKELVNTTENIITRICLKFFIVDPSKPIYNETGKIEYWKVLREKKLKKFCIWKVLSFLYISPLPMDVAKEKRRLVREAMKTEVSGWGRIEYEDAIDLEFFDAFYRFKNPQQYTSIQEQTGPKIELPKIELDEEGY